MFNTVGKIIHQHRTAQGLTIAQLAESANVSDSYISRIELGNVKDTHLLKLERVANALGLQLTDLFTETQLDPHTTELIRKLTMLPDSKRAAVAQKILELINLLD
ncbi:helix-turn-helix transcriptional regulator [Lactiplantibacillus paraxiangfangensis]|uniref:helix-turn-helix domain-containing protein n=1 Tax=Lactiplantibacillus paraxiangfangensis TaxID=3076224 RepID=UPI0030C69079